MKKAATLFILSTVLICSSAQAAEKKDPNALTPAAPPVTGPVAPEMLMEGTITSLTAISMVIKQKGGSSEELRITPTAEFKKANAAHEVAGQGAAADLKTGMYVQVWLLGDGATQRFVYVP